MACASENLVLPKNVVIYINYVIENPRIENGQIQNLIKDTWDMCHLKEGICLEVAQNYFSGLGDMLPAGFKTPLKVLEYKSGTNLPVVTEVRQFQNKGRFILVAQL